MIQVSLRAFKIRNFNNGALFLPLLTFFSFGGLFLIGTFAHSEDISSLPLAETAELLPGEENTLEEVEFVEDLPRRKHKVYIKWKKKSAISTGMVEAFSKESHVKPDHKVEESLEESTEEKSVSSKDEPSDAMKANASKIDHQNSPEFDKVSENELVLNKEASLLEPEDSDLDENEKTNLPNEQEPASRENLEVQGAEKKSSEFIGSSKPEDISQTQDSFSKGYGSICDPQQNIEFFNIYEKVDVEKVEYIKETCLDKAVIQRFCFEAYDKSCSVHHTPTGAEFQPVKTKIQKPSTIALDTYEDGKSYWRIQYTEVGWQVRNSMYLYSRYGKTNLPKLKYEEEVVEEKDKLGVKTVARKVFAKNLRMEPCLENIDSTAPLYDVGKVDINDEKAEPIDFAIPLDEYKACLVEGVLKLKSKK